MKLALNLSWLIALVALAVAPAITMAADTPQQRPNVIFLFADDHRADAIGALGHPVVKTPHLDTLVRSGFTFTNAYCLGANVGAVCTPSRNMLLSGRAYFRWQGPQAPADGPSFPAAMKAAGYETYHEGKRGNTAIALQKQFEHNQYIDENADRTGGEPGKIIVDHAIDFLKQRTDARPLFMYLAFGNPHDPRVAAQKYLDLYERDKLPLPKNFLSMHPFDNGEPLVRDERLASWPRTPEEIRKHLHEYYAVISALDGHIGRLLAYCREQGLAENTIFIYSADHGLAVGSHGLMGKQSLYEHSMKSPLIFSGPGIPHGKSDALAYLMDIFPTTCKLAGTEPPAGLDGKSLRGIIQSDSPNPRKTLFLAYRDVQRAIRDERYKLIRYPQVNVTQLFDLQADPDELQNLASTPGQQERVAQMTSALRQWQKELGDKAPLTVDKPKSPAFDPPLPGIKDPPVKAVN